MLIFSEYINGNIRKRYTKSYSHVITIYNSAIIASIYIGLFTKNECCNLIKNYHDELAYLLRTQTSIGVRKIRVSTRRSLWRRQARWIRRPSCIVSHVSILQTELRAELSQTRDCNRKIVKLKNRVILYCKYRIIII